MPLKLYSVSDGPPSLAVRMALKHLDIPYDLINVDFGAGEHMTEDFGEKNPQKEIPVLEDEGFFLSESNAILQYLCDHYRPDSNLYPKSAKVRALVHQRLCFNLSTYYRYISEYTMAPIFFDYERTPLSLKKVHIALNVLDVYLRRSRGRFSCGDELTIADLPLVAATLCLEAVDFDFSRYQAITTWYNTFKALYPELWSIAAAGMREISDFERNPPDLSHMKHPIHPIRKSKNSSQ